MNLILASGKVGILHGGSWSAQDTIALVVIVAIIFIGRTLFKHSS